MAKITLDLIKNEAAAASWEVISDKYVNLDTQMEFKCSEGHQVFAPWKKIRDKFDCPICKQNRLFGQTDQVIPKSNGIRRLLSLDQASHTTGYAIFDNDKLIKCGKFETQLSDEAARFSAIKSWLISIISTWRPDFVGIEGIQYQDESSGQKMGVTVFQTLARLQGILINVLYESKIPYEVCPTNTWRHSCGVKGRSRADRKRSMQMLVKQWYDISVTDDESDAIGIGHYLLTHTMRPLVVENWEE